MSFTIPPIYPITDKKLARKSSHLAILKELIRGGAQIVQIRDKSTPLQELLRDLRQCVEFASAKDIILILNDRCDLVLSCGATGVHLGQHDLPPDAARTILGSESIIGFSTHSLSQVRKAMHMPIHYIGFGPIYSTSTKQDAARPVGLLRLAAACKLSSVPAVAIGGITLDRVREVFRAGASSIAVISALMQAKSIARQMQCFMEKARER